MPPAGSVMWVHQEKPMFAAVVGDIIRFPSANTFEWSKPSFFFLGSLNESLFTSVSQQHET